jgi:PAS domain S-box-containing protein
MAALSDRSLFENLVESAPDALLVVDASGCMVLANRTAETMFGFSRNELLGMPIERLVPQRFQQAHVAHREGYAENPRTREMGASDGNLLACRKDGSEFPVEVRLSPVDPGGRALVAAAVRDATDRRHALQVLRAAQQEADLANAAKGRLLATASHDLRQPLQALQLLNAALQEQVVLPDAEELVRRQGEALEAMSRLVNALLDISRLEAGAVPPEIEDVNLVELFRTLQRELEPLARARGLTLTVSVDPCHARTDRTLLRQLLQNLLANALKYTESGSIRFSGRLRKGQFLIEVADTGIGISPEQLGSIFEEYYQVDRARRQGVGLGLSIVKRIASLLGLSIEARSEPGKGAHFLVGVPASQLISAARRQAATPVREQQDRPAGALILLIEDDDAVRAATEFYLKTMGHTAIGASGIAAAERALQDASRLPDLIITDYHLGNGETGIHAINRLRTQADRPLPALMLSGDTSPSILKQAQAESCRVLNKPVDVRNLVAEISSVLQEQRGICTY